MIAENTANRFEIKRKDIKSFIDTYTHTYVSEALDADVKELAKSIMTTGVSLMDACHVACAILANCDYFISTNKRLLKYQSDKIKLVNPIVYLLETESGGMEGLSEKGVNNMGSNTVEVIDRGLKCLSENLGADETEVFITTLLKERFDYTKWRQSFVSEIKTFDELDEFVQMSKQTDCFSGSAEVVL